MTLLHIHVTQNGKSVTVKHMKRTSWSFVPDPLKHMAGGMILPCDIYDSAELIHDLATWSSSDWALWILSKTIKGNSQANINTSCSRILIQKKHHVVLNVKWCLKNMKKTSAMITRLFKHESTADMAEAVNGSCILHWLVQPCGSGNDPPGVEEIEIDFCHHTARQAQHLPTVGGCKQTPASSREAELAAI